MYQTTENIITILKFENKMCTICSEDHEDNPLIFCRSSFIYIIVRYKKYIGLFTIPKR